MNAPAASAYEQALRRAARRSVIDALLNLASDARATADVRAVAEYRLAALAITLANTNSANVDDRAANAAALRDIRNWLDKRIPPVKNSVNIALPPGTPIGN